MLLHLQLDVSLAQDDILLEQQGKYFGLITFNLEDMSNQSDVENIARSNKCANVAVFLIFQREIGFYVTQVCIKKAQHNFTSKLNSPGGIPHTCETFAWSHCRS